MHELPNLDDMPLDEVQAFADAVKASFTGVSMDLFPNYPVGCYEATLDLGRYAEHRVCAGKFRLAGDIPSAQDVEREMQRIYDRLPEWARW